MSDAAGKTGGVRRIALVVNGDHAEHHRENAAMATRNLTTMGYEVHTVSHEIRGSGGDSDTALKAIQKLHDDKEIDENDEVVIYFTGHGDLVNGEPGVHLRDRTLFASEFVQDLKDLPCETTIVMDQCYSGNFAQLFADEPDLRFIGLSGKGLTDYCRPFAPRFWNPAKEADDNSDGTISWQERFDWATRDSGKTEYSMAVYFSGSKLQEKHFNDDVKTIHTRAELDEELKNLPAGQHAVVLYSAPWCEPCQAYKPDFKALSDGRYKFIIADSEDPTIFPIPKNTPVPHIRLYGYGLHENGMELQRSDKLVNEIPLYLSSRTPDALAKHWIISGTDEQQRSSVRILGELQPKNDRTIFYASLVERSDLGVAVRMEAIHQLGKIAKEHNEDAHKELTQFTRSKKLNISFKAECAAILLRNNFTSWDREYYGDMDFERNLLCNTMISNIKTLSPFAQHTAGYEFKLNTPESQNLARHIITTRKPHDVALGLIWNEAAIKLFGREMISIALDDNSNVDLRYRAIGEENLPWKEGERGKALKSFLKSENVPMRDKMDRLDSDWGNGTIRAIAHECMDAASRHEMAISFYESGAPLNGKVISFLTNMWDKKTGDPKILNSIASKVMTAITNGNCSSPKNFFKFLKRFKIPGRIDFFKQMAKSDQPKTTRLNAIEHFPSNPNLFPTLIAIAKDRSEDLTVRKQAIKRMEQICNPIFVPVINELSNDPELGDYALEQMWEDPAFDHNHVNVINDPKYPYDLKTNSAYSLSSIDLQIKLAFDPKTNGYVRNILLCRLAAIYDSLTKDQKQKILDIISTETLDPGTRLYTAFELPPPVLFAWLKKNGHLFDANNILNYMESFLLGSHDTNENRTAVQNIFKYLSARARKTSKSEKDADSFIEHNKNPEKEIIRIKNNFSCWFSENSSCEDLQSKD